ncbi:putative late blight resistance protein R1A-10 [Salvia divinorum]|uniref:Late blight resistance protein R1A-10 n=1 Tax=Salvia divinorum TaxID=28513 RepID=A0ABD1FLS7_SALDI
MAAYATLLSLARSTHPNNESLFSSEIVRSIHDYVNFLILFFQEFPHKVNRWETRIRDVAYKIEDIIETFMWQRIQSRHVVMTPSRVKLDDQLKNVTEEIGLIAGEVMEERPAYKPASSLRLAGTGSDAVIGLHEDILAIKRRLCGGPSGLQVIPIVDLVWNEKILQLIPNVKRLGLTYTTTQTQSFDLHRLQDLHQLEKLEVIGYGGFLWRRENPSFPCTLKKLTLVGGGFPWKDMPIVGLLPNLEILKLLRNACYGKTWETNDDHFPRLKYLLIDDSYLEKWITQSNPFPTLKCLVLRSCGFLREIPEVIGEIPTLELIQVEYCTTSLVESAKKIKKDQESCGNDDIQVVCAVHEDYMRSKLFDDHPKKGVESTAPVALNLYGYPLRPGRMECVYYVKTGQCMFGVTCKFHHPQLGGIGQIPMPASAPMYPTGQSSSIQGNWLIAKPAMLQGSYVPTILPRGVVPYRAPVSPAASPSTHPTIGAALTKFSPWPTTYTRPYLSTTSSAGPSRPGQPECQYYLRTGHCKFGTTCKYHHPPEWSVSRTNYALSPVGLPLRPGAPLCSHYAQYEVCKFGHSCKFDHPMSSLRPSSSSLPEDG